ncbi:hypothetical protein HELRODRAFT_189670 [Helobdella robusta]|uniref:Uncharacterized protein n=1 Tax=Helobdella robusta TaxID=6412 RepID=T1FR88_HELRO|nr:hypothetical protein HELRODRAFT_189670 [Helobdella robusta]ESN93067.1 hypothetical protein HELRODRAFT_189670 [Helobdella robusta]
MSTNGRAGYCTTIEDTQGVHPRKLKLIKQKASQDTKDDLSSENEEQQRVSQDTKDDLSSKDEEHFNTEEEKQDSDSGSQDSETSTTYGISIPTLSQSGVYKATMKAGEKLKEHFIETLRNEKWSLHFDGKHIKNTEYQVVVLKNENREVKLAVLALINGKGETIFKGIKTVLDEYKLWPAIKLIISDTTSANTGKSVGAVTRLQKHFVMLGLDKPLYIGCQHHVLDTLLKHVMNDYFEAATTSPNLNYWFISRITEEYQQLKASFDNSGDALKEEEEVVWRDDMAFLHHLITCYRQFKKTGCFPKSAEDQSSCDFISGTWSDIWFSGQVYNEDNLAAVCKNHSKAIKTLRTFWSVEPTPIPTQRSKQYCSVCSYATCCLPAYRKHIKAMHAYKSVNTLLFLKKSSSHHPAAKFVNRTELYCQCGYASNQGNVMACHMVACMKLTCYTSQPAKSQDPYIEYNYADDFLYMNRHEVKQEDEESCVSYGMQTGSSPSTNRKSRCMIDKGREPTPVEMCRSIIEDVLDCVFPVETVVGECLDELLNRTFSTIRKIDKRDSLKIARERKAMRKKRRNSVPRRAIQQQHTTTHEADDVSIKTEPGDECTDDNNNVIDEHAVYTSGNVIGEIIDDVREGATEDEERDFEVKVEMEESGTDSGISKVNASLECNEHVTVCSDPADVSDKVAYDVVPGETASLINSVDYDRDDNVTANPDSHTENSETCFQDEDAEFVKKEVDHVENGYNPVEMNADDEIDCIEMSQAVDCVGVNRNDDVGDEREGGIGESFQKEENVCVEDNSDCDEMNENDGAGIGNDCDENEDGCDKKNEDDCVENENDCVEIENDCIENENDCIENENGCDKKNENDCDENENDCVEIENDCDKENEDDCIENGNNCVENDCIEKESYHDKKNDGCVESENNCAANACVENKNDYDERNENNCVEDEYDCDIKNNVGCIENENDCVEKNDDDCYEKNEDECVAENEVNLDAVANAQSVNVGKMEPDDTGDNDCDSFFGEVGSRDKNLKSVEDDDDILLSDHSGDHIAMNNSSTVGDVHGLNEVEDCDANCNDDAGADDLNCATELQKGGCKGDDDCKKCSDDESEIMLSDVGENTIQKETRLSLSETNGDYDMDCDVDDDVLIDVDPYVEEAID